MAKPDENAWEYFGHSRSRGDFLRDIDALADSLYASGIRAGDRVGVCLPNCPRLLALVYAVNRLGAVSVMLGPKSGAGELCRQVRLTGCKMLIFTDLIGHKILSAVREGLSADTLVSVPVLPMLPPVFFFTAAKKRGLPCLGRIRRAAAGSRVISWRQLTLRGKRAEVPPHNPDADAVILFGSGTGGDAAAVVHSSRSINDAALRCLPTVPNIAPGSSMLAVLPSFHVFGLAVGFHIASAAGVAVTLMPFFHDKTVAAEIVRRCPCAFPTVPTMLHRVLECGVLQRAERRGRLDMSPFRMGFCGGDTADPADIKRFNDMVRRCGGTGFMAEGYGLTECCPVSLNPSGDLPADCVGQAFPGNEIIITDRETGAILPPGGTGEINVLSSSVMSRRFDADGNVFFPEKRGDRRLIRTGDVGFIDGDGILHFVCRSRRMVKISGHAVLMPEIERVIGSIGFIKEVCAVPVEHPDRGHAVFVFAVTDGSVSDDKARAEIMRRCCDELTTYAIPSFVRLCGSEDILRTELGKIAIGRMEKLAGEIRRELSKKGG